MIKQLKTIKEFEINRWNKTNKRDNANLQSTKLIVVALTINFLAINRVAENYVQKYSSKLMMQSYLPSALDKKFQKDWARDAGEGPRVLMSLRVDFGSMG